MAQRLSVSLQGELLVRRDASVAACSPSPADAGAAYNLRLSSRAGSADLEISQGLAPVDATGGPVALPYPANLQGRVLLFSVIDGGPFEVEVTHAALGATVYPVRSVLLIEPGDADYITGISVEDGAGTIQWVVTGTEA